MIKGLILTAFVAVCLGYPFPQQNGFYQPYNPFNTFPVQPYFGFPTSVRAESGASAYATSASTGQYKSREDCRDKTGLKPKPIFSQTAVSSGAVQPTFQREPCVDKAVADRVPEVQVIEQYPSSIQEAIELPEEVVDIYQETPVQQVQTFEPAPQAVQPEENFVEDFSVPAVPQVPQVPQIPEVPQVPEVPYVPEIPQFPSPAKTPVSQNPCVQDTKQTTTFTQSYQGPCKTIEATNTASTSNAASSNAASLNAVNSNTASYGSEKVQTPSCVGTTGPCVQTPSKTGKPIKSSGTFFPVSFGNAGTGSVSIANSFSTNAGSAATSTSTSYGKSQ